MNDLYNFLPFGGIIVALIFGYLEGSYLKKGNYITSDYKFKRNSAFLLISVITGYFIFGNLLSIVLFLLSSAAAFFLIFDYALNYFWDKPLGYLGDSAKTDKLLKGLFKTNKIQYVFLVKFWIFFLLLGLYISLIYLS